VEVAETYEMHKVLALVAALAARTYSLFFVFLFLWKGALDVLSH
jgi:hypothetical protein